MELTGKTILLTGGTGFLGSRTARRLVERGARIRAIVRRSGETPELRGVAVTEIEGDFVDRETARRAAEGCDAVIHCAATIGQDLDDARRVNVEGTRSVVEAALEAGCPRFVHVSTVAVYDHGEREIVDEETPLVAEGNQYALSKAEAEPVIREGEARGLRPTILRPSAILGVHPSSSWGVRVPERVRDGKLPLVEAGRGTWAYVHVENLVDAIRLALEKDESIGRVYNVVDGHTTWRKFTDEIRSWFDAPELPSKTRKEAGGSLWTGRYDASRIRDELGYEPRFGYSDGMAEAREYWKSRQPA